MSILTRIFFLTSIMILIIVPILIKQTQNTSQYAQALPCTTTVSGFDLTSINTARDKAGTGGVVCFPAGTYSGNLTASVMGQTWQFDSGAKLIGTINISSSGVSISGGTIQSQTTDRWAYTVSFNADDSVIKGVTFIGGGQVIGIFGKDRNKISNNTFNSQIGSAVSIWGQGVGADDNLIEGNTIIQTATYKVSPIMSRGSENETVFNQRTIVRSNIIDQGPGDIGWFGIEFKDSPNSLIEGNTIKGGSVLVSFPDSNYCNVKNNTLDLRESPYWGVEIAKANNCSVVGNNFIGNNNTTDAAVSMNTQPTGAFIDSNKANDIFVLTELSGSGHTITNNCLTNVKNVTTYTATTTTITANGPCTSTTPTPTPTVAVTSTPVPTGTAVTSTPTPTFTPIPTPMPSPTPVPTATPTPISSTTTNSFAGNYFWNTILSGSPYYKTVEAYPLSKNWGTGSPGGGLPTDNWSVNFTGVFYFSSGSYQFTASSDDGVRIYLDGKVIIDAWIPQALTTYQNTVPVTTGNHEVKVEYFEAGGNATLNLSWKQVSPTPTSTVPSPTPTGIPVGFGDGLIGSYFPQINLSGTPIPRKDSVVNFDWGFGSPMSGFPNDNFSVRWTGYVIPKTSENYTFYIRSDDGVRMWVNNILVINKWKDHAIKEDNGSIFLNANQKYPITVEYYEHFSLASIKMAWSSASVIKSIIPQSQLYTSK
nr:hypothetical protein [Candidatus Levybacteria bacterium]